MESKHEESLFISENDKSQEFDEKELERIREFRKLLMSESSDESLNKVNDEDLSFLGSQAEIDNETSAAVGTSKKSSSRNQPGILSTIISETNKKHIKIKPEEAEENNEDLDLISAHTESYEIDKLNMMETLALLDSDEEQNGAKSDDCESTNGKKIEQAVITILLTNRWQQKTNNKLKEPIKYQPTFRLEPKDDFNSIRYLVVKKIKNTFDTLCGKHKYNCEYTPKFLKVITELIKNDAKSFKLDRYKIVVHVTILKKILKQSIQFVSKELFSLDDDHKLSFKIDMISFHAVCLVFFIYHE